MSAAIQTPFECPSPSESESPSKAPVVSLATRQPIDPEVAERRREERELVAGILSGDDQSFGRLYGLYAPRIHRFAVKRLGDPVEAEDVVQDVFLEIHRCLGSWEGRSSLLTWMFGIAHHQLCRRFRKKTPIGLPMEQLEAATPVSEGGTIERRVDAGRALEVCADVLDEEISPAQREIFDLYYGERLATKEIARELGKSNQAVKISLFRTRRAMEARLEAAALQRSA
ncbi:MAG: RNA polymerase sigma factor [bacterium]